MSDTANNISPHVTELQRIKDAYETLKLAHQYAVDSHEWAMGVIAQAEKAINAAGHRTSCQFHGCSCGAVDEFKCERIEFFRLLKARPK